MFGAVVSLSGVQYVDAGQVGVLNPIKCSSCFIEQDLYPHCSVLVGSRNGFELHIHVLKQNCSV